MSDDNQNAFGNVLNDSQSQDSHERANAAKKIGLYMTHVDQSQPALNDGEKEKGFDRLINLVGDPDQEVGKTATTSLDAAASYLVGFDRNILKAKVEFVQNLELTDDARDRVNKAYNIVTRKGPQ